jgi:hypothetical protein
MLTGALNIAVFAAFSWCVGSFSHSMPEFKPVCRVCRCRFAAKAAMIVAKAAMIAAKTAR